ncbi:MAG: phosphodiesterase [Alphaproteobacteria bacterium]
MLIAQITDPHTKTAGTRLFGAIDSHGALARAVAHINALRPRPDVVVLTGDVINDGDASDYAQAAELISRLEAPVFPVPGNPDNRELLRQHFSAGVQMPKSGKLHYVIDDFAVRLIGLDTLVEGVHHGEIGPEQLAWLDEKLGEEKRPTLIFLHHPPFNTGLLGMDNIGLRDADALGKVVGAHSHIELVACGHVHRTIIARFAGTLAVVSPATAHQCALDLDAPDAKTLWIMEPPGVMLHRWAGGHMVSHVSQIGYHGPASPFHDNHSHVGK